jgi:hypothetical protein
MLMSYVDFMEKATGIPVIHYSVTMPDFPTDSLATDNAGYIPDAHLLGLMNVRFVVSEFDISAAGLNLVKTIDNTRIYENREWLPLAWVQPDNTPPGNGILSTPTIISSPNGFKIESTGPGKLVLSEVYYPGWKVYIDGKEKPVEQVEGIFMGIELTSGQHTVEFDFYPNSLILTLFMAGIAWTGIATYLIFVEKTRGKTSNKATNNRKLKSKARIIHSQSTG